MSNAARLATTIATLTLALSAPPAAADLEQVVDPPSHEVTVMAATAEQQELVDWALDRYEAAGLPIPAITVEFHDDTADCRGYLGYYDEASRQLDMCNWGQHYKITPASTLLHELAHAWSFEHMSAADRAEFTARRGLDHWHHDGPWWHMGQEQAAEIVAWAVGGEDFVSPYVGEADCAELAEAYMVMTGSEPPQRSCGQAS